MRKRVRIHKDYLQVFIFLLAAGLVGGYQIINEGASFMAIFLLAMFAFLCPLLVYYQWQDRYEPEPVSRAANDMQVELKTDRVFLPRGYFCKHSLVAEPSEIPVHIINEVNLQTFPPSLLIHHKEVIFLPRISKEELKDFATRNQLPLSQRFDIWNAIIEPFLDTEFDEEEKQATLRQLGLNGIPEQEVKAIRRKIRFPMALNMFAWEWVYLGQFDYLNWAPFISRKRYWWTMDIALRNYSKGA